VKALIEKGNMVPDELAIRLMEAELFKPENENGYILDGFPRELSQAEALDKALNSDKYAQYHMDIDLVLLLQVPDDYVIDRIIGRYQCAHCKTLYHEKFKQPQVYGICDTCGGKEFTRRADDTYETVVSRLRTFRRVTAPVIPYYEMKGLLVCVDGTGPIDVVSEKIRKIVGY
ncbi:MAG: nucleoside monophosphate kinase, partial [Alphaproteobacteria bacterium]|nr:nucleoside monophosphate kinase [Alphaproteobacteria bacterium]